MAVATSVYQPGFTRYSFGHSPRKERFLPAVWVGDLLFASVRRLFNVACHVRQLFGALRMSLTVVLVDLRTNTHPPLNNTDHTTPLCLYCQ